MPETYQTTRAAVIEFTTWTSGKIEGSIGPFGFPEKTLGCNGMLFDQLNELANLQCLSVQPVA
jgi:hypothetical protein